MTRAKKQAKLRCLMGKLTRKEFAEKIGRAKSTIDTWLAPEGCGWDREVDDLVLAAIAEKIKGEPK